MTATVVETGATYARAKSGGKHGARQKARVQAAARQSDLQTVAQHMYALMLRNVASDGFVFGDPADPGRVSKPGCVIAALTYPGGAPGVDQDYVFNWTRDAAITAIELTAAAIPDGLGGTDQPLVDYVNFARACQRNAEPTLAHACYTIDGYSRPWTEQSDGPALQSLAILGAFPQLDQATRETAIELINTNVAYLMGAYKEPTTNLWEEHWGFSFFARSAQLKCLRAVASNAYGIAVPAGISDAISWLESAIAQHWNGFTYISHLTPEPAVSEAAVPVVSGYDPNIDIVMASIYGAVACTDTKLLATAGQLRQQWADGNSDAVYPINLSDARLGMGPMMGRYPGDTYDGDMAEPVLGGHPWALCTANFAELYYNLAADIAKSGTIPLDETSRQFFSQVGIGEHTAPQEAVGLLEKAGDAMLHAVIYHSDHLELSEQFDGNSGFEKSVRDLTWSYAAFLSAVRARNSRGIEG